MRPVVGLLPPLSMANLILNPLEVSRVFTVPVGWLIAHPPELFPLHAYPPVGSDFPMTRYAPRRITFGRRELWRCRSIGAFLTPLWGLTARITMHFIQVFQRL